jgi:hypothetical protein
MAVIMAMMSIVRPHSYSHVGWIIIGIGVRIIVRWVITVPIIIGAVVIGRMICVHWGYHATGKRIGCDEESAYEKNLL